MHQYARERYQHLPEEEKEKSVNIKAKIDCFENFLNFFTDCAIFAHFHLLFTSQDWKTEYYIFSHFCL